MAVSVAYGDSTTYFRTKSDQQAVIDQAAYRAQMASNYQQLLNNPYNAYRNAYPPSQPVAAKEASTPSRVIVDQGFGGAESRPRSRRYRREPTPPTDVEPS